VRVGRKATDLLEGEIPRLPSYGINTDSRVAGRVTRLFHWYKQQPFGVNHEKGVPQSALIWPPKESEDSLEAFVAFVTFLSEILKQKKGI